LEEKSNVQFLHISDSDKPVKFYNLDVIISVGYRVKSYRGVHFRKWATALIKEYLIKGFAMNDELLKEAGGGNYFDKIGNRNSKKLSIKRRIRNIKPNGDCLSRNC